MAVIESLQQPQYLGRSRPSQLRQPVRNLAFFFGSQFDSVGGIQTEAAAKSSTTHTQG
jgi:hypothetical protein